MLGASGSCIIDVGGKDELDLFYRLCKKLNIESRFIADLDTIFKGTLRQSVSKDERCKSFLQKEGLALDLMITIGQADREIDDCLREMETIEAAMAGSSSKQFCESLMNAKGDIEKRRYIFLIGIKLIRSEIESLIPSKLDKIRLIEGRIQKVIAAFEQCRVYILPKGELENYLPTLNGDPYQISEKAKNDVFEQERNYILGDSSSTDICSRYGELIDILDKTSSNDKVDVDLYLNYEIRDWINKVQSAFLRGELTDKDLFINNKRIQWKEYARIFELIEFTPQSDDFSCKIKLKTLVDSKEREFTFDKRFLVADFKLEDT